MLLPYSDSDGPPANSVVSEQKQQCSSGPHMHMGVLIPEQALWLLEGDSATQELALLSRELACTLDSMHDSYLGTGTDR